MASVAHRVRSALAACTVGATLLAACGPPDPGADEAAQDDPGELEAGTEGEVLATYPFFETDPVWVRYNADTCEFEEVDDHPAEYEAVVRTTERPYDIAYTPQDDVFDFLKSQNASVREVAEQTGINLLYFDNEYPDTQKPLEVADLVVQAEPDVVLSMNVFADLYPAIMDRYNGACLPTVVLDLAPPPNTIFFGVEQTAMGEVAAEFAAEVIGERGWEQSEIWAVSCADADVGTDPGSPHDRVTAFQETLQELLPDIPGEQVELLNCPVQQGAEEARAQLTDWLTAHPDARYVVSNAINDTRALGMYRALETAGFSDNAVLVGIDADPAALEIIEAGDEVFVGSVSQSPETRGNYLIPLGMDIADGNPVPRAVYMPPTVMHAGNL